MTKQLKSLISNVLLLSLFALHAGCGSDGGGTDVQAVNSTGASAMAYPIVDTGQGTCYDNSDLIEGPAEGEAFYGQDAQYTGNTPSYTDNGDGTITDNITGLVWTQELSSYSMPWSDASGYCEALEAGGITNWRLPNVKELWSIRDFSTGWPWVDTDYFHLVGDGSDMGRHHSWTSNLYLVESEYQNEQVQGDPAFIVNDWTGHIKAMSGRRFVRCVSGAEYGINDFIDNGDGTVSDNATGLMWSQDDNGEAINWEAALAYAENATIAGYDDWRLPNAKELQSIADYSGVFPAMDTSVFNLSKLTNIKGQADYPFYWSSTTNPYIEAFAEGTTDTGSVYLPGYTYAWVLAAGYNTDPDGYDLHGAGSIVFDTKAEEVSDGSGIEAFYHHVRLVRGGNVTKTPDGDPGTYRGYDATRVVSFPDGDTGNNAAGNAGGPPDFAVAAEQLGVTEAALLAALGDPTQGEPDYGAAAATLGVTVEALQAALGAVGGAP
ncbi:hypothetical protein DESUT3_33620 [Desulfuromonas versatilis]|uniref:Lcl C-terminal domain-containing protein n=1 Tax=Desulfuromonas versatilis TaxID=2802975 RepID=A0ABM8I0E6_9BACT|nr:DUF1566 domain-containing protein [Desulfuromonas versatilis]BCR06293.1 hypothetical protein DESUT3_33620 [Desulfuromonas versatilis]